MRKRGEVLRERAAEGGQPAGSLAGIAFYACPSCGVRQSAEAARGGCIRCGADMQMGAQTPEAKGDGDPWALKGETKAPVPETKEPKAETPKTSAESRTLPLPLAEVTTTPLQTAVQSKMAQPMGADEMPFADIVEGLRKKAYSVSLVDVARWSPRDRGEIAAFLRGASPSPTVADMLLSLSRVFQPEMVVEERVAKQQAALAAGAAVGTKVPKSKEFESVDVYNPATGTFSTALKKAGETVPFEKVNERLNHTVTVTWGKEIITPIPGSYSTVEVGPFSISVEVPASDGLTRELIDQLNVQLRLMAEEERARKVESFVKALRSVVAEAKAAGKS